MRRYSTFERIAIFSSLGKMKVKEIAASINRPYKSVSEFISRCKASTCPNYSDKEIELIAAGAKHLPGRSASAIRTKRHRLSKSTT